MQNSARATSHIISKMMEDVWHKRQFLTNNGEKVIYLSYRVSVSNYETDQDKNFYFHFVIVKNNWFYTVSDKAPFEIEDHKELVFDYDYWDDRNWNERGGSYRHYAFTDCVAESIENKINQEINKIGGENRAYLWDTFPIVEFRM